MKTILALALSVWLSCAPAAARAAPAPIALQHSTWTARDGVPPNITHIEQTADGWLWLATDNGLYRFDGARFELYQPAAGRFLVGGVLRMGRLADGRLWITPPGAGVQVLDRDTLLTYTEADGLPRSAIYKLVVDADGRWWAASSVGLHVLAPGARRWQLANAALGLPPRLLVFDLLQDRRGTFWLLSTAGLFTRPAGAATFRQRAERHGAGQLAETPDGRVWASEMDRRGLQLLFSPPGLTAPVPDLSAANSGTYLFDRDGNLWLPGPDGVRQLVVAGGRTELRELTSQQGMTGAYATAFHQDREGNIWVASESGLDQFRPRRLQAVALPRITTFGAPLLAGPAGDVWIDQFYYPALGAAPLPYGPGSTDATLVSVLYRDPAGQLWSGARDGLWQVHGRQRVRIAPPPPLAGHRLLVILAMVMDPQGGLWVSFAGNGVFRWQDGVWTRAGGIAALDKAVVLTMAADGAGRLWFGTLDNTVFRLEHGQALALGSQQGLTIGAVEALAPYAGGLLVGGQPGLAWFDGKRFHPLSGAADVRLSGIRGLLLAADGALWINSALGLQGIDAAALVRATRQPGQPLQVRQFNFYDGLSGVVARNASSPRLAQLSTGELLFSTATGVYRLDPARYRTNPMPPPVYITGVSADNAAQAARAQVRLPAAPRNLRIDYTALSLTLPQRVQFRYLLDGVDTQWQEAGNRRAAYYTTLAPGSYRFRVMAANEDGVWNTDGASLTLVVPPTLLQTVWFKLLCLAALALLAWGIHRLRLRRALRRLQRSFDVRVAERERIARDLHDTLLQSVQGLILVFRGIAGRMPAGEPNRPVMERALSLAEEVMVEGRDKVGDLRQAGAGRNLAEALAVHGRQRGEHESAGFALQVQGQMRPLREAVREEAFAIGREAINNAFLHAQASRIDVTLTFGERYFELMVGDDGRGMQADGLAPEGHWGIAGMRERAAQMGATLALETTGGGAAWRLRVPPQLAYDAGPAPAPQDKPDQVSA
ncbi:signal transduction histidine kinase/ligand-binding sensor domain-containing protein [Duganella sp. 1224]|uniref:sensor histidine kinase n=1 Tax=Duganella sp. 1224 TaxID=2587052 RepID=UPI0015CC9B4D|nr:sensor histidine kinase [Duganella sp. 1224]NYE60701.1 signal transduction histidine kinase/ligand-binding sensor domain-containing protein [Duganella sp. 1224]